MEPLESERRVIEAAESLARTLGGDTNHSVAAAAMDTEGRVHLGVNVHHFTGGPCAGPQMRPIAKLLADTYFYPDGDAKRVFRFNKRYYAGVASGQKTSTVRWDEQISVGPVLFYFEDDEAHAPLHGQILEVQRYRLDDLTAERLRLSEGERVDNYIESLRKHYPLMPADALVDIVDFNLTPSHL